MTDVRYKSINVTKLRLDLNNPRYPKTGDQTEAFNQMIKSRKSEILKIARDIVDHGLNGSTFPIVYQTPGGECIVKDGNRRVTALKAIWNPSNIKGDDGLKRQFEILKQKSDGGPDKVLCAIYLDEGKADHWTEHNHLGSIGGIGKQEWEPEMKKRYRMYRTGMPDATMEMYDLGVMEMNDFEGLKTAPHITTIERLIGFKSFREELGFDVIDRRIHIKVPREDFVRDWKFIFEQLGNKDINVDTVKTSDKTIKWMKEAKEKAEARGKEIFSSIKAAESIPLTVNRPVETVEDAPEPDKPPTKPQPMPTTQRRNTLIPKFCNMSIGQTRINNLYSELKSANVSNLVNMSAISLRVFLELSLDHYMSNNPDVLVSEGKKAYLNHRLQAVSDDLLLRGRISKNAHDALRKACTADAYHMEITTELHQYVHNPFMNPDTRSIKDLWDNLEHFIKAIWSNGQ